MVTEMEQAQVKTKKKHRFLALKIIAIVLGVILLSAAALFATVYFHLRGSASKIERLDDAGQLYLIDYTGDLDDPFLKLLPNLIGQVGCSAFTAQTEDGSILTGRNYDYRHLDAEGSITTVDVLVRLHPEGKYASINSCDFQMFNFIGFHFEEGCLDDPDAMADMVLGVTPYCCEDGMNEMGLSAAILQVDLKDGETHTRQRDAGKNTVIAPVLLREILDNCATVEEAEALAESYNMVSALRADYHIYVADAAGNSAVLEWRNNELTCIDTDVCTNFYVGSDDGCDSYKRGKLYEAFTPVTSLYNTYHTGYGHGYARFNAMVKRLDETRSAAGQLGTLSAGEAMALLSDVSQSYDPNSRTSCTMWSVVFHNTEGTMDVCVSKDYSRVYSLTVGED